MNVEKQNSLIREAHSNAVKHGFWEGGNSDMHYLCLVLCELAEAVEAKRKNKQAQWKMFEWQSKREQPAGNEQAHWVFCFQQFVKDSLGDELADAYIRMCDLAGAHGVQVKEQRGMLGYVVSTEQTMTENVLAIASVLTDGSMSVESRLLFGMRQVERLAELEQVELGKHIEYKMRYNQLRAYKHGKAF